MTKIRKVKRRKKFQANINRKRLRNKLDKLPPIGCKEIKHAWEIKKSIRGNLSDMGLAFDPNEVLKIPNSKREAINRVQNEVMATVNFSKENFETEKLAPKVHVAKNLEKEARAPRERMFKLPKSQVQFVTYMMDKYEDDYKAMARDKKNYYQLTWRQIRAKIETFKNIPEQYAEYLVEKGEIVLDDPIPLKETKKQIASKNYQNHCISKKPKILPKIAIGWEEESIEITSDTAQKEEESGPAPEEKLKLFVEEEKNPRKDTKSLKSKTGKKEALNEASNGILQIKSNTNKRKLVENITISLPIKNKNVLSDKRKSGVDENISKRNGILNENEFERDENTSEFINLSDLSSEELFDDDILDDDILDDDELASDSEESE